MNLKEFVESPAKIDEESVPATNTTAGIDMPDAKPLGAVAVRKEKAFGHECLVVDSNTYHACSQGKVPFSRWSRYVEDEGLRDEIKAMYKKNKRLIVKDEKTGRMSFVK